MPSSKSGLTPNPLVDAFIVSFPECLGATLADPPPLPEGFAGLSREDTIARWKAMELDETQSWVLAWRLVAGGGHCVIEDIDDGRRCYAQVIIHASEQGLSLMLLAAIIGDNSFVYEGCASILKAKTVVNSIWSKARQLQRQQAQWRHALGAALVYGREDWVDRLWGELGQGSVTLPPDSLRYRKLWGQDDRQAFGHPDQLNQLIKAHWSNRFASETRTEGWFITTASAHATGQGRLTAKDLKGLLARARHAWKPGIEKEERKIGIHEIDEAWLVAMEGHDPSTEVLLRPWVRFETREACFLKACEQADMHVIQALVSDFHLDVWHQAIEVLIEKGPDLEEHRYGPVLQALLAYAEPRVGGSALFKSAVSRGASWLIEALLPLSDVNHDHAWAMCLAIKADRWEWVDRLRPLSETPSPADVALRAMVNQEKKAPPFQDAMLAAALSGLDPWTVGRVVVRDGSMKVIQRVWPHLPSEILGDLAMLELRRIWCAERPGASVHDREEDWFLDQLTRPAQLAGWNRMGSPFYMFGPSASAAKRIAAKEAELIALERARHLQAIPVTSGDRVRKRS